jgi:hypothetical protein
MQLSFQIFAKFLKACRGQETAASRAAERLYALDFFRSVFVVRVDNAKPSLIRLPKPLASLAKMVSKTVLSLDHDRNDRGRQAGEKRNFKLVR